MGDAQAEGPAVSLPLEVETITVRFGGLLALTDVSLHIEPGSTTGLIGPNGAGKTTLFNVIAGLVTPEVGTVRLFGEDVTSWPIHRRSRAGLARTFQRLELFGSLTVTENLIVAAESELRGGNLVTDLLSLPATRRTRRLARERAKDTMHLLNVEQYGDTLAGDLPTGVARLVELGRALCTNPRLLLLDEPSSGLRGGEWEALAALLTQLPRALGMSILLVEHDMSFVLGLTSYVYVLDFGQLLAEGSPNSIRANHGVQVAYLGEDVGDVTTSQH
jgi:branched-chain amino acid transport system ATP-binding protein